MQIECDSTLWASRPASLISNLDGVLLYLDNLLAAGGVARYSNPAPPTLPTPPPPPPPPPEPGVQRVMNLSFASVYELNGGGGVVLSVSGDAADDSGVDADAASESDHVPDYVNIAPTTPPTPPPILRRRRSSSSAAASRRCRRPNSVQASSDVGGGRRKYYEICLGYKCVDLQVPGQILSIFSLQKHQHEFQNAQQGGSRQQAAQPAHPVQQHQQHQQQHRHANEHQEKNGWFFFSDFLVKKKVFFYYFLLIFLNIF